MMISISKEKGSNFYASSVTSNSTIVDLMQPVLGFYSMPTAAYYGGDYASGELLSIIHTRGSQVNLPYGVQALLEGLSEYEYKVPEQQPKKQKNNNKKKEQGNEENNTKEIKKAAPKTMTGPDRLCVACLLEKPASSFSKTQYNKAATQTGGRCKECISAAQSASRTRSKEEDSKRGKHEQFEALKVQAKEQKGDDNVGVTALSETAMQASTVIDCTENAFDFFIVISDLENVLQRKQSSKHKGAKINIIHHPWVFPRAPPGKRLGVNINAGWVPLTANFPSPKQEEGKSAKHLPGKNSLRQDLLTQTRISVHPDKRDSWAMCFSPNNAVVQLNLEADMTAFFTVAHTLPKDKKHLRTVVSFQILLHKSIPAVSMAVNRANTVQELVLELEQICGFEHPVVQQLKHTLSSNS